MEPTSLVVMTVGVTVGLNLLILAAAYGRNQGTLKAHTTMLANHDRQIQKLIVQSTKIAATCAAYFATNPHPRAANAMTEVVQSLESNPEWLEEEEV